MGHRRFGVGIRERIDLLGEPDGGPRVGTEQQIMSE